jgi:hypothetical protein
MYDLFGVCALMIALADGPSTPLAPPDDWIFIALESYDTDRGAFHDSRSGILVYSEIADSHVVKPGSMTAQRTTGSSSGRLAKSSAGNVRSTANEPV